MPSEKPDLADPRWFPVDYTAERDAFRFLRVDLQAIVNASFLDQRMTQQWSDAFDVFAENIDAPEISAAPALLFHTAFCGSTLLARALDTAPHVVALKEPNILLTLSLLRERMPVGDAQAGIDRRIARALALLSRPWAPDGRVLIKPTNQANPLIESILRLSPGSRAILLYADLRSFLVSSFKKLPRAEDRIRWMAQTLLRGTLLATRLGIDPSMRFNLVESCALAWFAQMERYARVLSSDLGDRLRTLEMRTMLAQPLATVSACAEWLELDAPELASRVERAFSRDSKSLAPYSVQEAERAAENVLEHYGATIDRGIAWAEETIAPAAILPVDWKPLRIEYGCAPTG